MNKNLNKDFTCLGLDNFTISYFKHHILDSLRLNDDDDTIYLLSFNLNNQYIAPCGVILVQNIKNNLYVINK